MGKSNDSIKCCRPIDQRAAYPLMDLTGYLLWNGLCSWSLGGRRVLRPMQFSHHGAASVIHRASVVETFSKRDSVVKIQRI